MFRSSPEAKPVSMNAKCAEVSVEIDDDDLVDAAQGIAEHGRVMAATISNQQPGVIVPGLHKAAATIILEQAELIDMLAGELHSCRQS